MRPLAPQCCRAQFTIQNSPFKIQNLFFPQVQCAQRPVLVSALAQGRRNELLRRNSILMPSPAIISARQAIVATKTNNNVFI